MLTRFFSWIALASFFFSTFYENVFCSMCHCCQFQCMLNLAASFLCTLILSTTRLFFVSACWRRMLPGFLFYICGFRGYQSKTNMIRCHDARYQMTTLSLCRLNSHGRKKHRKFCFWSKSTGFWSCHNSILDVVMVSVTQWLNSTSKHYQIMLSVVSHESILKAIRFGNALSDA